MATEEDNSIKKWKIDEKAEVEDGDAEITFDIPEDVDTMGEHIITAEYLENWKYRSSSADRELYLGYHTYVHCPVIYIYKSQLKNLELVSNLFSNNKPVTGCSGKFKINKTTVSDKVPITDGHASFGYDGSKLGGKPLYMFKTAGKVSADINPGESNQAEIIIQDIETRYTALVVSVPTIMTGNNQEMPILARVYKLLHSSVIDESDIPKGGTITFYLALPGSDSAMTNNELYYLGMADITTSGYAQITASADIVTGVYTIIAVYDPPEWSAKYVQTVGSGTLYYSDTLIKPNITTDQRFVYNEGDSVSASFTSDVPLTGTIELYIDDQIVASTKVSEDSGLTFDFDIPSKPSTEKLWAYPGVHLMMIRYKTSDGYIHEYYFDFIIRYDTEVMLEHPYGFLDNPSYISYQYRWLYFHVLNLNLTTDEHTVYVPSGDMYISMYRSRPILSLSTDDLLMFNNDETASFTFTTDIEVTGTFKFCLDGVEIHSMDVDGVTKVTPTFIVPNKSHSYAYPGEHTFTISYTRSSDGKTVSWDYRCIIRYTTQPSLVRLYNENGNPVTVKYPDRTLYTEGNPLDLLVDNIDDPDLLVQGNLYLSFFALTTNRSPTYTCTDDLIINNDEVSNLAFEVDLTLAGTLTLYIDEVEVEQIYIDGSTFTTTFIVESTTDSSSYRYPGEHTLKILYTDADGWQFVSEMDLRIRYNVDLSITNLTKDESTGVTIINSYDEAPVLSFLAWNRELDEPVGKGFIEVEFKQIEKGTDDTGDDEPDTRKAVDVSVKDVDALIGDIATIEADVTSEGEPVNEGTVTFTIEK
ncbi:MAG: hypothetical protein LUC37_03470 [Prevotella sp.]|nr:hypothetical protein [Prevotella sp.]